MDDDLEDILDTILKAIDLDDPGLKDKLRQGLEKGFEAAAELGQDVKIELEIGARDTPDVVVLQGGRQDDADCADDSDPPDLSVISRDAGDQDSDEIDLDDDPSMRVRLFGSDLRDTVGRIDVEGDAQTVFRGAGTRPYRLHCEGGSLKVLLDGRPSDELRGGQSIDVEAALVQVSGDGEGWYVALRR
ncbi:MAG: hypothetical protein R3F61_03840 [Myxococcota bacterium]